MKAVKHILAFILGLVILTEAVGIQVIKDICTPCQNEKVVVKVLSTHHETSCYDLCHIVPTSEISHDHCSIDHACDHNNTDHEKDVKVISKQPDYSRTHSFETINLAQLHVVVNTHTSSLFPVVHKQQHAPLNRNTPKPPDDAQAILCTYLI